MNKEDTSVSVTIEFKCHSALWGQATTSKQPKTA